MARLVAAGAQQNAFLTKNIFAGMEKVWTSWVR
jgi:hypothetical protein